MSANPTIVQLDMGDKTPALGTNPTAGCTDSVSDLTGSPPALATNPISNFADNAPVMEPKSKSDFTGIPQSIKYIDLMDLLF